MSKIAWSALLNASDRSSKSSAVTLPLSIEQIISLHEHREKPYQRSEICNIKLTGKREVKFVKTDLPTVTFKDTFKIFKMKFKFKIAVKWT